MTRPKLAMRIAVRVVDAIAAGVLAGLERLFPDPVDDTMALAVSLGVVPEPEPERMSYVVQIIDWHAHPAEREAIEDGELAKVLTMWGREGR